MPVIFITVGGTSDTAGPTGYTPTGCGSVPFTPTVPGWIGLKANDPRGSSGIVLFSKGPYAVQAVSTGDVGIDQADRGEVVDGPTVMARLRDKLEAARKQPA